MDLPEGELGSDDESRFWGELQIAVIAAMVNVLLNDGQAKRKVSKLVGSWAVADNQAKLIGANAKTESSFQVWELATPAF